MAQILAIDFGLKRTGLAATDDAQIIASGLDTVPTGALLEFLKKYSAENRVETIVVGQPTDLRGQESAVEEDIRRMIAELEKLLPDIPIVRFDERFTSKMASYYISQSGKTKKAREDKSLIDKVSATLLLQNYLEYRTK